MGDKKATRQEPSTGPYRVNKREENGVAGVFPSENGRRTFWAGTRSTLIFRAERAETTGIPLFIARKHYRYTLWPISRRLSAFERIFVRVCTAKESAEEEKGGNAQTQPRTDCKANTKHFADLAEAKLTSCYWA